MITPTHEPRTLWGRFKARFELLPRWKKNVFYIGCFIVGLALGFLIENGLYFIERMAK